VPAHAGASFLGVDAILISGPEAGVPFALWAPPRAAVDGPFMWQAEGLRFVQVGPVGLPGVGL
jgi:hypothetical protein